MYPEQTSPHARRVPDPLLSLAAILLQYQPPADNHQIVGTRCPRTPLIYKLGFKKHFILNVCQRSITIEQMQCRGRVVGLVCASELIAISESPALLFICLGTSHLLYAILPLACPETIFFQSIRPVMNKNLPYPADWNQALSTGAQSETQPHNPCTMASPAAHTCSHEIGSTLKKPHLPCANNVLVSRTTCFSSIWICAVRKGPRIEQNLTDTNVYSHAGP
jgi:hypothetical protein